MHLAIAVIHEGPARQPDGVSDLAPAAPAGQAGSIFETVIQSGTILEWLEN